MKFNDEYKKFEIQYDNETENNMDLYEQRNVLSNLILSLGSNSCTQFANSKDEISFLKEYKEFLDIKRQLFPSFVFDDFDAKKFQKCVEYKSSGHSLLETEEYYINEIKNQKKI